MLRRSAPLKRVPFKRAAPRETEADDLVVTIERLSPRMYRVPAPSTPIFCPQPKHDYVRSEALLVAVRKVPYCTLCSRTFAFGEHADPAHSNWSGHGKAGGVKADDNRIAALCRIPCHAWVDASGDDWFERFVAWWGAHGRTVLYLTQLGLWPRGVPIPDTYQFPNELTMDSG